MSVDIKEREELVVLSEPNEPVPSSAPKTISKRKYIILSVVFGFIFVLSIALFSISIWYRNNYFLEFKELLYVLTGPIEGTGGGMTKDIVLAVVPYSILAVAFFTAAAYFLRNKDKRCLYIRRAGCIVCSVSLIASLVFTSYSFRFNTYFNDMREKTTIYEDYYIDPATVAINASGRPKNLIYIYVESLEITHGKSENGGFMTEDYIPGLTKLAQENLSFTTKATSDKLGGFRTVTGSGWTIAALLATSSGIPFAFSVGGNNMDNAENFAPNMTNLGDILEQKGYNQEFLCGSEADFGGRTTLFAQHGGYDIYDLDTARKNGDLPSPFYYNGWWGYEDKYLFEIAKKEAIRMASENKPFNLTMLTVDTHPQGGYICDLCGSEYPEITANVLKCTDKLVYDFVEWCKTQDFYKDTVIVITGDHPRHDNAMVEHVNYGERSMYNCFINCDVAPLGATTSRVWTSLDVFPTVLASLGFSIDGDRLGLGVNMFSGKQTLAEQMGFDQLNAEMNKFSEFYLMNFAYGGKDE